MASVKKLVSQICNDPLLRPRTEFKCSEIIKEVKIPAGWKETYKLENYNPSYTFRLKLMEDFVDLKKSESYTISDQEEFIKELKGFLSEKESHCSDDELHLPSEISYPDLFEKNWKIEGVVVRKSDSRACVLVKSRRPRGPPKQEEMVLSYNAQEFPGLGIKLKVGDILCVARNKRKVQQVLEPEVVRHYFLEESEIDCLLSTLLEMDTVSSMLIEINQRCFAAWKYILNQEQCSKRATELILRICGCICSSVSRALKKVMEEVAHSKFLSKVVPTFIENNVPHQDGDDASSEICRLLQNCLLHVLKADPSCGQRVLVVAKCLTTKMVEGAPDFDCAKKTGTSVCEFLCKLSSVLALNVPGAFSDLESLDWRQLPLIPTAQEIQHIKIQKDDLPKMRERYNSEDEYLNTNFRLIREECFYKLKKGISDYTTDCSKQDARDMMMYRITLRGISTRKEYSPAGLSLCLSFEEVIGQQQSQAFDLESTSWLLYGNLLCISLDGQFTDPIWVLVERKLQTKKDKVVWVTFCTDRNRLNDAEVITKLQELRDEGKEAYMAESSTFYTAFGPAMDVLQEKETVPFKEYIVDADCGKASEPASYIRRIKCPPDWNILYETEAEDVSKKESSSDYSLLDDFSAKTQRGLVEKLDPTQMAAVEMAFKQKVALIQGPPGTGKSYVGVSLVRLLLSMKVPQEFGPILVVTYKNHALDNFLLECLKIPSRELKLVRVGSPDEALKDYTLGKIASSGKWSASNYSLNKAMRSQLFGMQSQIRDCYDKLRKINVFGIDTFIQVATDAQLKSLLTHGGSEIQSAEPREVEKILKDHEANPQLLSREQRDLIKKGLESWLPKKNDFETCASECISKLERAKYGNSATNPEESARKPRKEGRRTTGSPKKDEPDGEDPVNCVDRSTEEKERRLAVDSGRSEDEEDEEDIEAEQEPGLDSTSTQKKTELWERHLPHVNDSETSQSKQLMNARNIFELTDKDRISLVYVMQKQYREKVIEEFKHIAKHYTQKYQEFEDLKNQRHIDVLSQRHVIGMTVTGAALRANLLANIKPSVMIVEEAAEILEPQLVAVIPPSVQHLIMIGDHKQLPPTVKFNRLARQCQLNVSMFERLVKAGLPQRSLGFQSRMRDELAEPLRVLKIYDKYETNTEIVRNHKPPRCVKKGLYFIHHNNYDCKTKGSHSYCNPKEAKKICEVLKRLCDSGEFPSKISVLCSYRGQVLEIERRLKNYTSVSGVEVTTIDSFQGKENDIIIVSLVRSNSQCTIGFLSSMNRLCVAISRAQCALYLFGNSAALCQSSKKGWMKFIDHLRKNQCIGEKFPFYSSEERQQNKWTSEEHALQTDTQTSDSLPINIIKPTNVFIGDNTVEVITNEPGRERTCPPTPTEGSVQETETLHSEVNDVTTSGKRRPAEEHPPQPETLLHTESEGNPKQDEARPGAADVDRADEQVTQESDHTTQAVQEIRVPKGDRMTLASQEIGPAPETPLQESEEGAMSDQKPVLDTGDVEKPPATESTPHAESSFEPKEGFIALDTPAPLQEIESSSISKKNDKESRSVKKSSKEGGFVDLLMSTPGSGGESDSAPQELKAFELRPVSKSPLQESEEGAMSDQKPVQDSEDVKKPPITESTPHAEGSLEPKEGFLPLDTLAPLQETENSIISKKSDEESRSAEESSKEAGFADPPMSTPGSGGESDSAPQELKAFESWPVSKSPLQESEEGAMSDQKPVQDSEDVKKPPITESTPHLENSLELKRGLLSPDGLAPLHETENSSLDISKKSEQETSSVEQSSKEGGFSDSLISTPGIASKITEPVKKSEAVEKNETTTMEERHQGAARVDDQFNWLSGGLFGEVLDQNSPPEESGALEIPLD